VANYTVLEQPDVSGLEAAYGLAIGSMVPLDGGMATSSYIAETDQGTMVVSVLDNQDDTAALRLAQTNDFMWSHHIPTCEVLRRLDGELISPVRGKSVMVKRFLPGETRDNLSDELLPRATQMLGMIHNLSPENLEVPIGLRHLSLSLRDIIGTFPNTEHVRWLRHRLARLDDFFPPEDDPRRDRWTLIHGDFTPSNIVISEGQDDDSALYAIDWETVTIDDPMLDCGMSAMNMCVIDGRLSPQRLKLFGEGYRRSGRVFEEDRIRVSVEYAAVIVAFHRYRRHNIRFPNPARKDYYKQMVEFVEREFPED